MRDNRATELASLASERREPATGGTDAWLLSEQAAQGLLIGVHPTPCGAGGFCALVRTWGAAPGPNNSQCCDLVLEELCFPEKTWRLKVDLDSIGSVSKGDLGTDVLSALNALGSVHVLLTDPLLSGALCPRKAS